LTPYYYSQRAVFASPLSAFLLIYVQVRERVGIKISRRKNNYSASLVS